MDDNDPELLTEEARQDMLASMRKRLVHERSTALDIVLFMDVAERLTPIKLVDAFNTFWNARI
jgi:hypothetical protein